MSFYLFMFLFVCWAIVGCIITNMLWYRDFNKLTVGDIISNCWFGMIGGPAIFIFDFLSRNIKLDKVVFSKKDKN